MEDDVHFSRSNFDFEILGKAVNYYFKANKPCVYHLGALGLRFESCPQEGKYNTILNSNSGTSHAVIFNREYMKRFVKNYRNNWYHIDFFKHLVWETQFFIYKKPLAYQLYAMTDNMKNWTTPDFNAFVKKHKLDKNYDNWEMLFAESVKSRQNICRQRPLIIITCVVILATIITTVIIVVLKRKQK